MIGSNSFFFIIINLIFLFFFFFYLSIGMAIPVRMSSLGRVEVWV
jgi:hypothetical protein